VEILHRHHLGVVGVFSPERQLFADVRAVHEAVASKAVHSHEDSERADAGDASAEDRADRGGFLVGERGAVVAAGASGEAAAARRGRGRGRHRAHRRVMTI